MYKKKYISLDGLHSYIIKCFYVNIMGEDFSKWRLARLHTAENPITDFQ